MRDKALQTGRKLRGGYYTPDDLAAFMVRWVRGINPGSILEPSCGDGVFLDQAAAQLGDPAVTAFEIDRDEATKSARRAAESSLTRATVRSEDFLGWAGNELGDCGLRFDAVLGNPPFIRYQYLPAVFQRRAERIFNELGCRFTKHINAWVPFVLGSFRLLRPGGRLAMVVPTEIIHVTHARSLRRYLASNCQRVVIIDPEELWFPETLQGAVLLLAQKRLGPWDHAEGIGIHHVRGREFLDRNPEEVFDAPTCIDGPAMQGKWTRALLAPHLRTLLDGIIENRQVRRFDEVAEVDVGIVTGANSFFLVSDETVHEYGLEPWAHPMFGRSGHCPGVIYDKNQHVTNAAQGSPTNFVWFRDSSVEKSAGGRAYIRRGEQRRYHVRYKCRIREPWYAVPSVYATDVGLLKRSHNTPRLILNEMRAYTTDTAYRVRVRSGSGGRLVFNFVNALTALSAELEGRHYGGGVLELVPSEIENLLLAVPDNVEPDVRGLDRAVRTLAAESVLERQSRIVLGAIGVPVSGQDDLLDGWKKLRDRRQRTPSPSASAAVSFRVVS